MLYPHKDTDSVAEDRVGSFGGKDNFRELAINSHWQPNIEEICLLRRISGLSFCL